MSTALTPQSAETLESQDRPLTDAPSTDAEHASSGDSFVLGLAFMLAVTVVQRVVGFARSVLFCGMMQDEQLGRWSLAFSFLLLAAPLAVLGLPGSFGRYVEYYRQRNQLGTFLRRTVGVSVVLSTITVVLVIALAPFWAWLVFGDAGAASLVRLLGGALACVIAFNFVVELLTAVRQVRVVAVMQFVSSVLFAVIAIALLAFTNLAERGVIIAFGAACLVAIGVAARPLSRIGRQAVSCRACLPHARLWEKLLPFAAWIWVTDLLANLFDAADRIMIVHFARVDQGAADSIIGQYHASRVVPFLLVAVAGMVAGVILPYMSRDWERGNRSTVARRQLLTLKIGGLVLTMSGGLILLGAPLLFGWLLHGRYDQGLTVLPITLTYCVWFSLMTLAQNYLWCTERARLGSIALAIGLAANIGLNVLLLPWWGLQGAVLATAIANAVALVLVLYFGSFWGLIPDRGTLFCCALPVTLIVGAPVALVAVAALAMVGYREGWLFNPNEKRQMLVTAWRLWQRVSSHPIAARFASSGDSR